MSVSFIMFCDKFYNKARFEFNNVYLKYHEITILQSSYIKSVDTYMYALKDVHSIYIKISICKPSLKYTYVDHIFKLIVLSYHDLFT